MSSEQTETTLPMVEHPEKRKASIFRLRSIVHAKLARRSKSTEVTNDSLGEGDVTADPLFDALHEADICDDDLAHLINLSINGVGACEDQGQNCHIAKVARYFSDPAIPELKKLECMRALMTFLASPEDMWQVDDKILKDTLRFVMDPTYEWTHEPHSEHVLLCALRQLCIPQPKRRRGEATVEYISNAATKVERTLERSIPRINSSIEKTGENMKRGSIAKSSPSKKSITGSAALSMTGSARRASGGASNIAKRTATHVQDAANYGVEVVAKRLEDGKLIAKIIPNEDRREKFVAVSKVSVAALGAAAIVSDAIFETAKAVGQQTATVASEVAHHKYGATAGKLVEDAGVVAGNVATSISMVSKLEKQIMIKAMAKTVGAKTVRDVAAESERSRSASCVSASCVPEDSYNAMYSKEAGLVDSMSAKPIKASA